MEESTNKAVAYMRSKFNVIKTKISGLITKITPGRHATKSASRSLLIASLVLFSVFAVTSMYDAKDGWLIVFFAVLALLFVLNAYLATWLIAVINSIPKNYKIALFVAMPLLFFALAFEVLYLLVVVLFISLIGGSIGVWKSGDFKWLGKTQKTISVAGGMLGMVGFFGAIYWVIPDGFELKPIINAASLNTNQISNLPLPSPAEKGSFKVNRVTYGHGSDKHRPEFNQNVTIKTESVDGTPFLDNWSGFSGWYREYFWGFNAKQLPLNASVWYPDGAGPFPLVLMVHGNHLMSDFSDNGYAYLGELLASRGIIFASVDQNFINASWADITGGLEEENDARGWLLLEHLRLWHEWNAADESIFFEKIDTNKLALVGHSRGGEAVAHAALFNLMPYYYDDATIPLNFNFNIESLVAIAPVDGQYKPGMTSTALSDINYLVMHGAQDGDVSSFAGAKQYERVSLSESSDYFKAGVYAQGVNHGQFNTSWGENDTIGATKLLNNLQLLSARDQRAIAEVYISAFFDVTLQDNDQYLPLFRDARKGKEWLPETIYLTQFQQASFIPLATFDDDFDVTTAANNSQISATNLSVWREQEVELKWGQKGTRAAYIGWHYDDINEENTIPEELLASFVINMDADDRLLTDATALVFSLAESAEPTNPKASGKWVENLHSAVNNETEAKGGVQIDDDTPNDNEPETPLAPIDFTLTIKDKRGEKISFPLSQYSALQRLIEVRIWKAQFITGDSQSENIFQTFHYSLNELNAKNPNFDFDQLQSIEFSFDKTPKGVVILDTIGFM